MLTDRTATKPRMRKHGEVWICYCDWARAVAGTPKDAYVMWKAERLEWAIFAALSRQRRWRF